MWQVCACVGCCFPPHPPPTVNKSLLVLFQNRMLFCFFEKGNVSIWAREVLFIDEQILSWLYFVQEINYLMF